VPKPDLARILQGQIDRKQYVPAVAVGGATGYAAVLAQRLAKMEEEKAKAQEQ
jgi:hypothetical protein